MDTAERRRASGRRLIRLGLTVFVASTCMLLYGIATWYRGGEQVVSEEVERALAAARSPAASASPTPLEPSARAADNAASTPHLHTAKPDAALQTGTGRLMVVPGSSSVSGPGRVRRFVVEVEEGLAVSGSSFASTVQQVLFDGRSWGGNGSIAFQRAETGGAFRVTLASSETTRGLCRPYDTGRSLSCYVRGRAILNYYSWINGRPFFPDIASYRAYMINHEVGHAIGRGHAACPHAGHPAPVMMQQSKGLNGCVANGWPLPSERG